MFLFLLGGDGGVCGGMIPLMAVGGGGFIVGGIAIGVTGNPAATVRFTVGFKSLLDIFACMTVAPVDILLVCNNKYSSCFCTLTNSNGQLNVAINAPLREPAKVDMAMVDNMVF